MNLLGSPGYSGPVVYEGMDETLEISGVHPHIYGKKETKPYRKMGHITITGHDMKNILEKCERVKNLLHAKTK